MVYWIIAVVLAGIGVALFILPHHQADYGFASLARDFRELVTDGIGESPGAVILQAVIGFGCLGVFLPALLAAAIAVTSAENMRTVLILGGVLLLAAGLATGLVEIVSNMQIGWGSGSKYRDTGAAFLAPLFPILCGAASILMGALRVRLH